MKNIAFITKSAKFDSLINTFRKSSINAQKKDLASDLSSFNVIICDLGYPMDLAYTFLEKINHDFNFSDKVIISIITHKSQIIKLRSLELGCDGYISPNIEYSDLVKKIREIDDPEKFLIKKDFDNTAFDIQFDGSLTHISETGCLVISKASIDPQEEKVDMSSSLFDQLQLNEDFYFSVSKSNPTSKKSFITEVKFSNLHEESRHKIRKMIHEWGAK
ncbi:response regulator [Halobacteriovorax sp. HLS]|uniref:response regulator n=1 Tax=Halobacteriovorax sp. HLS TaxID=2234000 RepID=UPI000FDA5882|nr:response regulator [Halobacteriovorax sp. HLS]